MRVAVHGEVDLATCPRLVEVLGETIDSDTETVIVDLGDVSFLDVNGLTALQNAEEMARANRCRFLLASPSSTIRTIVDLTGLGERLRVLDDEVGGTPFTGGR